MPIINAPLKAAAFTVQDAEVSHSFLVFLSHGVLKGHRFKAEMLGQLIIFADLLRISHKLSL